MAYAKIQNGTGSRTRTIKVIEPWTCACGSENARYWGRCPDCKEKRP